MPTSSELSCLVIPFLWTHNSPVLEMSSPESSPLPVCMSPTWPLWVSSRLTQPGSCVLLIRHLPPAVSTCTKVGPTSKLQLRNSALCWHIFHNPLFWLCFCLGTGNSLIITQNFFLPIEAWLGSCFFTDHGNVLLCCPWMGLGIFSICQIAASLPLNISSRVWVQPGHRQVGLCDFAPSEMHYFGCEKVWENFGLFTQ